MKTESDYEQEFNKIINSNKTETDIDTDINNVLKNEEQIKIRTENGPLEKFKDDITDLIGMLKAYKNNTFAPSLKTLITIAGTLIYIFSPLDLVPDIIPIMGLIDDASITALCLASIKSDIERFREQQKK